jgi:hypothetical protein
MAAKRVRPRVPDDAHQRPRRLLGDRLRSVLRCPLCQKGGRLTIVAYRQRTARFECRKCGFRFSASCTEVPVAMLRKLQVEEQELRDIDEADNNPDFPNWFQNAFGIASQGAQDRLRLAREIAVLSRTRSYHTPEERREIAELLLAPSSRSTADPPAPPTPGSG